MAASAGLRGYLSRPATPELGYLDERAVRLSQVLTQVDGKLFYTYDFGDRWKHDITLEKILPASVDDAFCTSGKGACPPDDCGGEWGYEQLKATVADTKDEEHENLLRWLGLASGDEFDATRFSTEETNRRLARRK